ncbi:helix-turn-helix domain-containing protein [Paenibacillus camerounensis]|uniref:helix-turn-helix domain-containing protein n=1 Tax=Paenibacillus camerounensis TaxID=1243663 RepID=UPI0005AA4638|nr:helix-turn-helix domain-containing protein [Paenibacillus camerounensis]
MKRSWYSRMLFSYFPVFLLVVSVLIFLAFMIITELSRSETQKANYISTSYIADTVERTLSDAQFSVLDEIENNYAYNDFFDRSGAAFADDGSYEIVQSMNRLAERISLIDSIYIYRSKDRQVLSQSGYVDLDLTHEAAYIDQISQQQVQSGWSPVRLYQPRNAKAEYPVVSLARRLPIPLGSDGYIVINISVYRLERLVEGLTNGELSFVRIKDSAGTLMYDSSQASGDGMRKLSTIQAESLGWTFESGLRAGRLFDWISVISYVWIVIGLVTISLGVLYIIYITRRNYRPIKQLMIRIQALQPHGKNEPAAAANPDELALMHTALDSLVQLTTDYERERYENLMIQRRQLFLDIMGGERIKDVQDRLTALDPFEGTREFEAFVVFAAEINTAEELKVLSRQEQNLLKFALTHVISDLMAEKQLQAWSEWVSGQRLAVLIGLRRQPSEDSPQQLLELAKGCHSWILDNLRLSLTFGVGHSVNRMQDIHLSYTAAAGVLSHRLALGTEIAAVHMDRQEEPGLQSYKYFDNFTRLVREFRLSGENWRSRLEEILSSFRKDRLKDEEIYMLLEVMLQALEQELKGISETLDRQFALTGNGGLQEQIRKSKDLEEIRELLTGWLNETYHVYVSVNELKSHRVMIKEVKHYIEGNYANPDLSLNHLSERFQISGKYASYLFKEEFNMKFVDFLAELRIRKAKELLDNTQDSIQDIALQIGYANAITFGRVFKRVTGMTPGDHRKLNHP